MHRPTPRDWLLLATGSTYKFTLTGFYFVTLFAVLKQQNYDLNRLSWLQLIGGIEAGKVLFAALMDGRACQNGSGVSGYGCWVQPPCWRPLLF